MPIHPPKQNMDSNSEDKTSTQDKRSTEDKLSTIENLTLQAALGPLVKEFQLLWESVNTVHSDYSDLEKNYF